MTEGFIPIAKVVLSNDEIRTVVEVLKSGCLRQGKKTEEFERAFAEKVRTRYAVAVGSCPGDRRCRNSSLSCSSLSKSNTRMLRLISSQQGNNEDSVLTSRITTLHSNKMKETTAEGGSVMTDSLMTVEEAAKYLKVKESTVHTWSKQGKIPAIKIGRFWRFKKEDIDKWLGKRVSQLD